MTVCSCKELYRTKASVAVVHDLSCPCVSADNRALVSVLVCAFNYIIERNGASSYVWDVVNHLCSVWNCIPKSSRTYMLHGIKMMIWSKRASKTYENLLAKLIERDKESPDPVDD